MCDEDVVGQGEGDPVEWDENGGRRTAAACSFWGLV